jgi:hypothetical protein
MAIAVFLAFFLLVAAASYWFTTSRNGALKRKLWPVLLATVLLFLGVYIFSHGGFSVTHTIVFAFAIGLVLIRTRGMRFCLACGQASFPAGDQCPHCGAKL